MPDPRCITLHADPLSFFCTCPWLAPWKGPRESESTFFKTLLRWVSVPPLSLLIMSLFALLYLLVTSSFTTARSPRHVGLELPETEPRFDRWAADLPRYLVHHEKRASQYLNGRTASELKNMSLDAVFWHSEQSSLSMGPAFRKSTSTLANHMQAYCQSPKLETKPKNYISGSSRQRILSPRTRSQSGWTADQVAALLKDYCRRTVLFFGSMEHWNLYPIHGRGQIWPTWCGWNNPWVPASRRESQQQWMRRRLPDSS